MESTVLQLILLNNSSQSVSRKIRLDFHVERECRFKYDIDESLFALNGDLIIANFSQARLLADKINNKRKEEGNYDQLVTAGQINALGVLHEIFHFMIGYYEKKINPGVMKRAVENLKLNLSNTELDKILSVFINKFPPVLILKEEKSVEEYLNGKTGKKQNRELLLEELILLHLENMNPATAMLAELYSDKALVEETLYTQAIDQVDKYFYTEKHFGKENLSLIQLLKRPIISNPYNLEEQLDYIIEHWNIYVYDLFNLRLLKGKDLIREDIKLFIQHGGAEKATPPVPVYDQDNEYFNKLKKRIEAGETLSEDEFKFYHSEIEKFTDDTDWMPKVVMIAKNAFVWLDQLSKKYQTPIHRLDQIPDEELDTLAGWNITALWLIGIWERSSASKKIKELMGNHDAAASAYSLYDYEIANELGGEEAFQNLKIRAGHRGIRLASDMVPNHTGIYSRWIIDNPDFYIQTAQPPYPNYSFRGPNLSDDERLDIRIEDKYYSHSDAAVVFQRKNNYTGDIRYIYHGNDGTNMPWNDTAQLNLLLPEVREALIQAIMKVARKTPIIRFDAAMTLTKQHYQRLWFPIPGTGGAIPSRSDYSMTRQQFDSVMPEEFWREVVDRMNNEMPNVLLLAEAFWLMEGYFVRSLGMHRVYNSAFMHMMMKEENEKYKLLIRNTLEFNPQILKRYVNFMSNPDEETAVNQFGKGDKYFGVCIMMVTLPGLPMFGHGQVEGFSEKYGMEYKRAYYNEHHDEYLISRHEAEIFPLMKLRHLFSQVEHFQLYDLVDDHGYVNENVFAFTNRSGNDFAFVIYNNAYKQASGTIKTSSKKVDGNKNTGNISIAKALNIKTGSSYFYIYTDHRTKLQFIVRGRDLHEHGFFIFLNGYEYRCCINWQEKYDSDGKYLKIYQMLNGTGVRSIEELITDMEYSSLNSALSELFNEKMLAAVEKYLYTPIPEKEKSADKAELPEDFKLKIIRLLNEISIIHEIEIDYNKVYSSIEKSLITGRKQISLIEVKLSAKRKARWVTEADKFSLLRRPGKLNENLMILFFLLLERILAGVNKSSGSTKTINEIIPEKFLINSINTLMKKEAGFDNMILLKIVLNPELVKIWRKVHKVKNLSSKKMLRADMKKIEDEIISALLVSDNVHNYAHVNVFQGVTYFNKEQFENLLRWLYSLALISISSVVKKKKTKGKKKSKDSKKLKAPAKGPDMIMKDSFALFNNINNAAQRSGYQIERLKGFYKKEPKEKKQLKK